MHKHTQCIDLGTFKNRGSGVPILTCVSMLERHISHRVEGMKLANSPWGTGMGRHHPVPARPNIYFISQVVGDVHKHERFLGSHSGFINVPHHEIPLGVFTLLTPYRSRQCPHRKHQHQCTCRFDATPFGSMDGDQSSR